MESYFLLDQFISDLFHDQYQPFLQKNGVGFPIFDQYSDANGTEVLELALAGYRAEDLKVSTEGSKLTISSDGASSNPAPSMSRKIARRKFQISWTDQRNEYELDKLTASFVDGILQISIPRKESAKPKVFDIYTNAKAALSS